MAAGHPDTAPCSDPDDAPAPSAWPGGLAGESWRVQEGDSLQLLAALEDCSVDAVVTDPPYGIDFQDAAWDGRAIRATARARTDRRLTGPQAFQAWVEVWAAECLRVLKPGGHLVAFGAPRVAHRLTCGVEEAGFEIRDNLMWVFGQGMAKGRRLPGGMATVLRPGHEPMVLARRPLDGTVEENVARWGAGALNVEACRHEGRLPANLVLTHDEDCDEQACTPGCAVAMLDQAADLTRTGGEQASRFFYAPKARRAEREAGCEQLPARARDLFPNAQTKPPAPTRNPHPTVKPLALMRWLVRLTCPPGGLVLDPFCGSGTTGAAAVLEGRRFHGVELSDEYAEVARARIGHWQRTGAPEPPPPPPRVRARPAGQPAPGSGSERLSPREPTPAEPTPGGERALVYLHPDAVEDIARRVHELIAPAPVEPSRAERDGELLTAAEVAVRFKISRTWVYANAEMLGAIPLGTGTRPRLRFDPATVAQRLNTTPSSPAGPPNANGGRSRPMSADSGLLPILGEPELSSTRPEAPGTERVGPADRAPRSRARHAR